MHPQGCRGCASRDLVQLYTGPALQCAGPSRGGDVSGLPTPDLQGGPKHSVCCGFLRLLLDHLTGNDHLRSQRAPV